MNCKKGDVAIIIISNSNLGKIVTCGELVINPVDCLEGIYWTTDIPLNFVDINKNPAKPRYLSLDCRMKPLRDGDGEDESLSWKPVPTNIKETS